MHAKGKTHAFTLVEVLMACVILGTLAALVFPLVSNSIATAHQVKCASNMRQIGRAILLHAADRGGALPITSHSTGDSRILIDGKWVSTLEYSWVYQLADYLGNVDEIRICPADERDRRDRIRELNATSYLLNDVIFDSGDYNNLTHIPHPSETLIMFVSNRPVSRTWDHAHCAQWTTWPALCTDIAPNRHRRGPSAPDRLNGSSNYLYADGHVKNIPADKMKQMLGEENKPWLPE